jgi:hypothetical protein
MIEIDKDGYIHCEVLDWACLALMYGIYCLCVLVLSIERGDDKLPIDPVAWENTMSAMEWMLMQHIDGAIHGPPVTQEHLERLRRVHALGTEAISGGERAAELVPLVEQVMSSLQVRGWRWYAPGYPLSYPLPEGYGEEPEPMTSGSR